VLSSTLIEVNNNSNNLPSLKDNNVNPNYMLSELYY
jgi:hypothetical protein